MSNIYEITVIGFLILYSIIFAWFSLYKKKPEAKSSYTGRGLIIGLLSILLFVIIARFNTDPLSDGMFPFWLDYILVTIFYGLPILILFTLTGLIKDHQAKSTK